MAASRYSPTELESLFSSFRAPLEQVKFIVSPAHKRLREMYSAGRFATGYNAFVQPCSILWDLHDTQSNEDFHLEVAGRNHPFELTEAVPEGRRRGDEYKRGTTMQFESEDYDRGHEMAPKWIQAAIDKKVAKHYSDAQHLNLLIYVNFAAHSVDPIEVRKTADESVNKFGSVWLITGTMICSLHAASDLGSLHQWHVLPGSTATRFGVPL